MKPEYRRVFDRFRALHGDVEVISEIAYWPIETVEPHGEELDATKAEICRFVRAGYEDKSVLQHRLRRVADLDHHIACLIDQGWLVQQEGSQGQQVLKSTRSLDELTAPETPGNRQNFDAVSRTKLDLPMTASFLKLEALELSIPIIVAPDLVPVPSETVYLECLLLLALSGPSKARSLHVFHQQDEVISLQEILYDLVLDGSQRLKSTKLLEQPNLNVEPTPPKEAIQVPSPSEPLPYGTAASSRPTPRPATDSSLLTRNEPGVRSQPKVEPTVVTEGQLTGTKVGNAPSSSSAEMEARSPQAGRPPEIIFGQKAHEQVLDEALRKATKHVVIVVPFIRRRINEFDFKQQLLAALRRGVSVSVIHGMPSHADQFDDTPYENQRIEKLAREAGKHQDRLKFIRVTSIPSSMAGEHSKILICDDRWAVVTSFNWLSVAETNETGVRFDHQDAVSKLLHLFDTYLRPGEENEGVRSVVTSPWPPKAREMSEWLYGEYNSQ